MQANDWMSYIKQAVSHRRLIIQDASLSLIHMCADFFFPFFSQQRWSRKQPPRSWEEKTRGSFNGSYTTDHTLRLLRVHPLVTVSKSRARLPAWWGAARPSPAKHVINKPVLWVIHLMLYTLMKPGTGGEIHHRPSYCVGNKGVLTNSASFKGDMKRQKQL